MRILLIDDGEDMGEVVGVSLRPLVVDHVFSLAQARDALANSSYVLFLIDVSLPDGDGFRFCRELSETVLFKAVPRILLTGLGSTADKVFGLSCGADDYVTKPFAPAELKARVEAKLRRQESEADTKIFKWGGFEFNHEFQRCSVIENDQHLHDLHLTPTEFRLFAALAKAQGEPRSREELARLIWQSSGSKIELRGIDSHVRHLRQKLGVLSPMIVSVRGQGYAGKDLLKKKVA